MFQLYIPQAETNLARYGRAMLQSLPQETTQLLIDLCTSSGPLVEEPEEIVSQIVKQPVATASYLSYLALRNPVTAPTITSSETATPPSPSIKTVKAGTRSRQASVNDVSGSSTPPLPTSSAIATRPAPPPPVKRISPRIYFAHFVDHMKQFVVFLETVALRRWGQSVNDKAPGGPITTMTLDHLVDEEGDRQDQVAVWNTLLELYLTLPGPVAHSDSAKDKSAFDEKTMREKAMRVLGNNSIPYDPTHALILCSTHGFTAGLVLLWERMGMYEEVLRFWMDRDKEGNTPDASMKVINQLMQYGSDHPHLYPLVLRFLTSTPELLDRHKSDLKGILDYIDEENLIPPLGVIQVLSRNGVTSVGLVKEWLMTRIKESNNEIQSVSLHLQFNIRPVC